MIQIYLTNDMNAIIQTANGSRIQKQQILTSGNHLNNIALKCKSQISSNKMCINFHRYKYKK